MSTVHHVFRTKSRQRMYKLPYSPCTLHLLDVERVSFEAWYFSQRRDKRCEKGAGGGSNAARLRRLCIAPKEKM